MTITENFKRIIEIQKQWGYYFPELLNEPASNDLIQRAENELGFKFNAEIYELYALANGAREDHKVACGKTGLIPIHNFFQLEYAVDEHQIKIGILEHFSKVLNNSYPGPKLLPFLYDGGGCDYWVNLNDGPKYGWIYSTNSAGDPNDFCYSSLTIMFDVIRECYETDVFSLDEDEYLDADYHQFGLVSQKHDPEVIYWDKYLYPEKYDKWA
jgi:cell wall assembly regulator SMI1